MNFQIFKCKHLLILFLFIFFLKSAYSCDNSLECNSECAGSIGTCINGNCIFTQCLFSKEEPIIFNEQIKIDNEYLIYSNDIVDNINLSENDIKNKNIFYNTVIEWAKINTAIVFAVGMVFSLFIIFFVVLLWQLIKTNAILRIIALILLLLVVSMIVLITIGNPEFLQRLSSGDFSVLSFDSANTLINIEKQNQENIISKNIFSKKALLEIDSSLNYAKELKINYEDEQISLVSLEFNNENSKNRYVEQDLKRTNYTDIIMGRIVNLYYISKKDNLVTYRIEDGKEIYLISGNKDVVRNFIGQNVLMQSENSKKIIINSDIKKCTNSSQFNFYVTDRLNIIENNNYTIKISGIKVRFNQYQHCDKVFEEYVCFVDDALTFGKNDIKISIIEQKENLLSEIESKEFEIMHDNIKPNVDFDKIKDYVKIQFSDIGTKIDYFNIKLNELDIAPECYRDRNKEICNLDKKVFLEGNNFIQVDVKDICGNYEYSDLNFFVDNTPPKVNMIQKSPLIIELLDNSGVKVLTLNDIKYDVNDCLIVNGVYTCTFLENITFPVMVFVQDLSENSKRILLR